MLVSKSSRKKTYINILRNYRAVLLHYLSCEKKMGKVGGGGDVRRSGEERREGYYRVDSYDNNTKNYFIIAMDIYPYL